MIAPYTRVKPHVLLISLLCWTGWCGADPFPWVGTSGLSGWACGAATGRARCATTGSWMTATSRTSLQTWLSALVLSVKLSSTRAASCRTLTATLTATPSVRTIRVQCTVSWRVLPGTYSLSLNRFSLVISMCTVLKVIWYRVWSASIHTVLNPLRIFLGINPGFKTNQSFAFITSKSPRSSVQPVFLLHI